MTLLPPDASAVYSHSSFSNVVLELGFNTEGQAAEAIDPLAPLPEVFMRNSLFAVPNDTVVQVGDASDAPVFTSNLIKVKSATIHTLFLYTIIAQLMPSVDPPVPQFAAVYLTRHVFGMTSLTT